MSIASNKAKGRVGENGLVSYLRGRGFPVERRRLTGVADCGDLSGLHGWTLDCKVRKGLDLSGWVDSAKEQAAAAEARFGGPHRGAVVIKRRMHTDPARWFVVMALETFASLLEKHP